MTKSVLVPTEGSPLSTKALEVALTDYPDAAITVLHVMDPIGSGLGIIDVMRPQFHDGAPPGTVSIEYWREWHEQAEENAEEVFQEARELAADSDTEIETVLEFGKPADVIIEYSDDHDVDRIVMGSHCRSGAERFLLGSVAETVVKRAPTPVMIVR
ncbi:universal stress protein [Natronorubrum thiooxidans]|uniref:Nucleotide-binding universal stress protein, UspA family n=1 Tax=Natronorubrum thiooxidans TaxID=308853 RepID=A0A1N7HAS8_9EURY|nr:universal stress protein [Natronorubrum thiooxidans]SIS21977.1 Nucleotide-binding universal stress protein, UspA family [Natronorubrum thiooxidans]